MSEIRAVYSALPGPMQPLFIAPGTRATDRFWRSTKKTKEVFPTLLRIRDINAATAILAMVKEEENVQSPEVHKYAVKATADLMGDD